MQTELIGSTDLTERPTPLRIMTRTPNRSRWRAGRAAQPVSTTVDQRVRDSPRRVRASTRCGASRSFCVLPAWFPAQMLRPVCDG